MTELRKCPFCGGEARTWEDFDGWRLYCTKCDATFRGGTEEELIEAWNKRVTPTTKEIEEYIEKTHKEKMELVAKLKRKYEVES